MHFPSPLLLPPLSCSSSNYPSTSPVSVWLTTSLLTNIRVTSIYLTAFLANPVIPQFSIQIPIVFLLISSSFSSLCVALFTCRLVSFNEFPAESPVWLLLGTIEPVLTVGDSIMRSSVVVWGTSARDAVASSVRLVPHIHKN